MPLIDDVTDECLKSLDPDRASSFRLDEQLAATLRVLQRRGLDRLLECYKPLPTMTCTGGERQPYTARPRGKK